MKRGLITALLIATSLSLAACGKKEKKNEKEPTVAVELATGESEPVVVEPPVEYTGDEAPEGMVRSELTNMWIDENIKDQRPIAVMVDNEKTALPHFGLNKADIVYEMMNSTMNGRVTRFMVIYKDWKNIEQLGSVRSTRPTNIMVAAEYNAILVHDGGPFYINDFVARKYCNHLSGGFARFSNGKSTEFTEYVTSNDYKNPTTGKSYDGLIDRVDQAGFTENYNDYFPGQHFAFSDMELDLAGMADSFAVNDIDLPFPHNSSKLKYNADTKLYEYSEYGEPHVDPLDNNNVLTFKNVILQSCTFTQLDDHGYLVYNVIDKDKNGYYITNGQAIPIKWEKAQESAVTVFTNANTGEIIRLNTGKTYIAIVPSDKWSELGLK